MIATSASASANVLTPPTLPVRSPQTSIILAELARQRRWERRERRKARARRAAWLALFNPKPFDLISVRCPLRVTFSGAMPIVYALPRSW
jgi:hypothetical protein